MRRPPLRFVSAEYHVDFAAYAASQGFTYFAPSGEWVKGGVEGQTIAERLRWVRIPEDLVGRGSLTLLKGYDPRIEAAARDINMKVINRER